MITNYLRDFVFLLLHEQPTYAVPGIQTLIVSPYRTHRPNYCHLDYPAYCHLCRYKRKVQWLFSLSCKIWMRKIIFTKKKSRNYPDSKTIPLTCLSNKEIIFTSEYFTKICKQKPSFPDWADKSFACNCQAKIQNYSYSLKICLRQMLGCLTSNDAPEICM